MSRLFSKALYFTILFGYFVMTLQSYMELFRARQSGRGFVTISASLVPHPDHWDAVLPPERKPYKNHIVQFTLRHLGGVEAQVHLTKFAAYLYITDADSDTEQWLGTLDSRGITVTPLKVADVIMDPIWNASLETRGEELMKPDRLVATWAYTWYQNISKTRLTPNNLGASMIQAGQLVTRYYATMSFIAHILCLFLFPSLSDIFWKSSTRYSSQRTTLTFHVRQQRMQRFMHYLVMSHFIITGGYVVALITVHGFSIALTEFWLKQFGIEHVRIGVVIHIFLAELMAPAFPWVFVVCRSEIQKILEEENEYLVGYFDFGDTQE